MISEKNIQNKFLAYKQWAILCLIIIFNIVSAAELPQTLEYSQNVKAAFIYNFTRYINWDNQDSSATFKIAILGEGQIINLLNEIANKRLVNHKDIDIRQINNSDPLDQYQIIFITESEKKQLTEIVGKVLGKNILTVSETEGALEQGVMINFLSKEETIKFEINLRAMKEANFQPSSQLLKVAVRIIE